MGLVVFAGKGGLELNLWAQMDKGLFDFALIQYTCLTQAHGGPSKVACCSGDIDGSEGQILMVHGGRWRL